MEQLDSVSFSNYLRTPHNVICGRHSIGLLLYVTTELQKSGMKISFSFLNHARQIHIGTSPVSCTAGAGSVEALTPPGCHLHVLPLRLGSQPSLYKGIHPAHRGCHLHVLPLRLGSQPVEDAKTSN